MPVAGIVAPAVLGVLRELLPDVCPGIGPPDGSTVMMTAAPPEETLGDR